jgi:hypothetical protein
MYPDGFNQAVSVGHCSKETMKAAGKAGHEN